MHLFAHKIDTGMVEAKNTPAPQPVLRVATPGHKRVVGLIDLLYERGLSQIGGKAYQQNGYHVFTAAVWGDLVSFPAKTLLDTMLAQNVEDDDYIDVALVGLDMLSRLNRRKERRLQVLGYTGRGRCRMEVLVKGSAGLTPWDVKALEGWTIYTSYVRATVQFLKYHGVNAHVVHLHGQEEFAVRDKAREACVCMYETGGTAKKAGLVPFATVLASQFVLVARAGEVPDNVAAYVQRLVGQAPALR